MAALTFGASFDGLFPSQSLSGGLITTRSATSMTYVSDLGFTVTLRGTGLTYDSDGLPSGGTLTRTTVAKDGTTNAGYEGVSMDFARAGMLLFGYGGYQNPDTWTFINLLLKFDDLMIGSSGHDEFAGSHGNDTIQAGAGNDGVGGEGGNDVMDGGDGWDTLVYADANYSWEAYRGLNLDAASGIVVDCWGATDTISNFEAFTDSLYSDTLKGSGVDESFVINRGNDDVNGRGGFDWVSYTEVDRWGAQRGVSVNLPTGIALDSWNGTDRFSNIEAVEGSRFNDILVGNAGHNAFAGAEGLDRFDGGGGVDTLVFVWNPLSGTAHGVSVDLSKAVAVLDDGYGNAETAVSIEEVERSHLADRLVGNAATNRLMGNDGNDTLNGGLGHDTLVDGLGRDLLGGGGGDFLWSYDGADTLKGGSGPDTFFLASETPALGGADTISDMTHLVDAIGLGMWWSPALSGTALTSAQFIAGAGRTTAATTSQVVIYNTTTGRLYFDADGSGTTSAAVWIATLSKNATLTFSDFTLFV